MSQRQKLLAGVLVGIIIILAILTFFVGGKDILKKTTSPQLSPTVTLIPTPTPLAGETIMVTSHAFVPTTISVKKGKVVNFANFSDVAIEIVSDDNPPYEPLNIGRVENNDSTPLMTMDKPGTYKYSNRLNPSQKGTIVVQYN